MSITDPLADAFVKIKNAYMAKKEKVDIKSSRILLQIVDIFKREGFIQDYKFIADSSQGKIRIYLRYIERKKPALNNIKKISKPGRRVYVSRKELPRVLGGIGIAILSTSKGIFTDEEARKNNVGGEVICYVY